MYVWATALTVVNLALVGLNMLGLPGNWLMLLAAALVAWANWDRQMIGWPVLVASAALAAMGEAVEFLAGSVGAKHAGSTRRGAWGALLGGTVGGVVGTGLIPVPVLGSLIGAAGGACVGAAAMEMSGGMGVRGSVRAGIGAGVGTTLGRVGKTAVGVLMWIVLTVAAFWP